MPTGEGIMLPHARSMNIFSGGVFINVAINDRPHQTYAQELLLGLKQFSEIL